MNLLGSFFHILAKMQHPSKFIFSTRLNSAKIQSWEEEGGEDFFFNFPEHADQIVNLAPFYNTLLSFNKMFSPFRLLTLRTTLCISPDRRFRHIKHHCFPQFTHVVLPSTNFSSISISVSQSPNTLLPHQLTSLNVNFSPNLLKVRAAIPTLNALSPALLSLAPIICKSSRFPGTLKPYFGQILFATPVTQLENLFIEEFCKTSFSKVFSSWKLPLAHTPVRRSSAFYENQN